MQIVSFGQAEITDISKLVLAYVLGLPVGWYREREAHSVGLRTFPLVAAASCGYVLVAVPLGQKMCIRDRHGAAGQQVAVDGIAASAAVEPVGHDGDQGSDEDDPVERSHR